MNKVNPLHILLLFIIVTLFLFVQIQRMKKEVKDEEKLFIQSKELALKTKEYKGLYNEKNKKRLDKILAQPFLKSTSLHVQHGKNGYIVSASSLSLSVLNSFMNKIFNEAYKIQKLHIKRVDEKHVALKMEIAW